MRTQLLKSNYRLDADGHPELAERCQAVAEKLEVKVPVTLYQATGGLGLNAMICHVPGEAHIVFTGPILSTLKGAEIDAVLAHELAHYRFWEMDGGDFMIADRLLIAAANDRRGAGSHAETARRFRLYTEIFADRGSFHGCGQLEAAVDTEHKNLEVIDGESEPKQLAYVTEYRTWEHLLGHHDASTDILSLGQLLASLSLGLDFSDAEDLGIFAGNRANLFAVNARLHPVLAAVIVEMTELNRHRRSTDLPSLIRRLESYREQSPDIDVTQLPGFADAGLGGRRRLVQSHLRDRLFEISRRNRLIYFKPSQASLNLTVASVPLVMNLASVRLEDLFVWHPELAREIVEGKHLSLGRWLRFEDQPYLPGALDKLISDARRDRAEYGFAQLRLVIAFLHWHNLKEEKQERIVSPLLLLPVELARKKGVRDQYILDPSSSEAEVNPALRHHLHQLYGLRLPESVDLSKKSLEQFHRDIETQIRASERRAIARFLCRARERQK